MERQTKSSPAMSRSAVIRGTFWKGAFTYLSLSSASACLPRLSCLPEAGLVSRYRRHRSGCGHSLPTDRIYDGLNMIPYFAGEQVGPDRTLFWRWADLGQDRPARKWGHDMGCAQRDLEACYRKGYDGTTASSLRSLQRCQRVAGFGPHSAHRRGRPPATLRAMEYADDFCDLATRILPRATTTRIGRGLE